MIFQIESNRAKGIRFFLNNPTSPRLLVSFSRRFECGNDRTLLRNVVDRINHELLRNAIFVQMPMLRSCTNHVDPLEAQHWRKRGKTVKQRTIHGTTPTDYHVPSPLLTIHFLEDLLLLSQSIWNTFHILRGNFNSLSYSSSFVFL